MNVKIEASDDDQRGYRLSTELVVAESRERLFDFFADAHRLEAITPPWLQFSVVTPRPIDMAVGVLIDYKLRLRGVPIRWRSKISVWNPCCEFVDEQVNGPYRYWRHLHSFEEFDGGTRVRDEVRYAVPLSWIAHPLFVRRDLTKIFQFRRARMSEIFTPLDLAH